MTNLQTWDNSRLIAALVVGGSSTDTTKRRIAYPLWEKGWDGYINDQVTPLMNLGFTRFFLHNPAGALLGEQMQADQFIEAKKAGFKWVEKGFIKNWRKVTEQVEVTAYLGDLKTDPDFNKLLTGRLTKDNWLKRMYDSYKPILDSGMGIAFDALFEIDENNPNFRFLKLMDSIGVKTYVEPIPHKSNPHLFKTNFVITEQLYRHKSDTWAAKDADLTGEKIRLLNVPYDPTDINWKKESEWLVSWLKDCKNSNYSASFGPWDVLRRGLHVNDLIQQINADTIEEIITN